MKLLICLVKIFRKNIISKKFLITIRPILFSVTSKKNSLNKPKIFLSILIILFVFAHSLEVQWKQLEVQVREWAKEYRKLDIVTGPFLTPNLPTIEHDKVAIPKHFYKAILVYLPDDKKAIGFFLPNKSSK